MSSQSGRFAFHHTADGGVDFIGEIVGEFNSTIRLHVVDAIAATGSGLWFFSGEVRSVARSECRFFADHLLCLEEALQINQRIYGRRRSSRGDRA